MNVFKAADSERAVLVEKPQADNSHSLVLFIMVFLASLFYTLSTNGSTPLRIGYSILLYGSLSVMLKVFLSTYNRRILSHDNKYTYYFILLLVFAMWNAIRDYSNPNFSLVTLINHPRALACLIPVLGLCIGYNIRNLKTIEKVINGLVIAFCLYAGYVTIREPFAPKIFTACILPFAVFNLTHGRYKILTPILFAIAAWHSVDVDYRTLLLRLIFFAAFFLSLNLFRKIGFMKFATVVLALVGVYIFLTGLTSFLEYFASETHLNEGLASDTRTFLYTEVFEDLSPVQRITGKGFLGTYFSQVFLGFQSIAGYAEADSYNRFSVEVGVLQLILKGGYIFLVLYLAPIIYTVWKGLSVSDKSFKLEFNICIYLLTELVIFFFENMPAFNIHFFMIFFFTGYVYKQLKQREWAFQASKVARVKQYFDNQR
ncbi:MAG TPA: hypothetical protein VLC28_06270 [Flavitalea sp.]|nr:hypothetical protein [Flavitalea sp.]